jgi:glycosyltransferase involved in cell wall biosynthesis
VSRRIALIIHSLKSGGAERVLANLANYWASHGDSIVVLTMAAGHADAYELHPAISRWPLPLARESKSVPAALAMNLRRCTALRRSLRQLRPDVAISFTTSANVLLACASLLAPWVAIGSEHNWPERSTVSRMWKVLRRWTYSGLAAVTCLTPSMAAWLRAHTNVRRTPIMPNPVWPIPAGPNRVDPGELDLAGRRVLLGAGRLERQKGFDMLIDAFATLADKHQEWSVVILGEGSERAALQRQLQERGLRGRVFLPGVVGNIEDWYRRADIYVMSSRFEGFGNTLAEALACGTPAVSFDCQTGPSTIIRHEMDGLLVPPEDVPQLCAALDRLMSNATLRREFSSRAVEAQERFSIEAVARQWNSVIDGLLQARRATDRR